MAPQLQQKHLSVSSWTQHLSVHMTSSNQVADVASSTWYWAKVKRFTLLASCISWQYALPLNAHLSDVQQQMTVHLQILNPQEFSSWWSWIAVVSSSNHIYALTISLISQVIFNGLPWRGCQAIDPVSRNRLRNLSMPILLPERPSCLKYLAVVGAFHPW